MYLVCKADERLYNLAGFVEVNVLTNVLFSSTLFQLVFVISLPHFFPRYTFTQRTSHSLLFVFFCGLAAASGDKPASHRQSGSVERQSVRERDGIGQSCDRDVKQDPAGSTRGIRAHGQGNRGTNGSLLFL